MFASAPTVNVVACRAIRFAVGTKSGRKFCFVTNLPFVFVSLSLSPS